LAVGLSSTALLWTWIAAGIALFLAANFALGLRNLRRQASSSLHWPCVPGEIVACEVKVPKVHSSDDEDTDCSVALAYRYSVADKEHRGSRIHASREPLMTRRAAEELAARYPVGAKVEVHYRADRPGTALLEPKAGGNFAALIVFLVVALAVALVLVAHGIAGRVLMYGEGGVPLFAFLLPLACLALAAGAVYEYLRLRKLLHESANWPMAAGRISASAVVEEQSTDRDDHGKETTSTTFRPDIRFAYEVGGREFHSSQWKWGWTALYAGEDTPKKIVAKYQPGMAIAVHYDPKDPANAVLEPANRQGSFAPLCFAFVFAGGGTLMLWVFTLMRS
jgi:hypothetical protein